ncbi:hypothetical protein [Streptomyces sp. NPDC048442]|uniref:hypothetical protein n=1 Tax=Streptomyces sp. NPDC048442 TaxID=3154823 RepID=UPI00341B7B4E
MTTIHPIPVGTVPALADTLADTACALADAVADGWPADRDGVLDAVDGLDVLLGALARLDDDTAHLLAPAALAAARLRQHLDPHTPGGDVGGQRLLLADDSAPTVPAARTASGPVRARPKRRGLGPGGYRAVGP